MPLLSVLWLCPRCTMPTVASVAWVVDWWQGSVPCLLGCSLIMVSMQVFLHWHAFPRAVDWQISRSHAFAVQLQALLTGCYCTEQHRTIIHPCKTSKFSFPNLTVDTWTSFRHSATYHIINKYRLGILFYIISVLQDPSQVPYNNNLSLLYKYNADMMM